MMDMCLTGEPITGRRGARRSSIVNYAVPAAELDAKTSTGCSTRIVDKSPTGIRLGKQALSKIREMGTDSALEYAQFMLANMARTQDAREGFAAFNESRAPELDRRMSDEANSSASAAARASGATARKVRAQLVQSGGIDYLVLDYLAEITMSILARMKAKNPDLGYATDFVTHGHEAAGARDRRKAHQGRSPMPAASTRRPAARARGGVRGGRRRSEDRRRRRRRPLRAGSTAFREQRRARNVQRRAAARSESRASTPISAPSHRRRARHAGADIVLTGRCVDSALALGPLIHEFGWSAEDYDRLSAGTLAGHVIECGAQATGGIFTDWRAVAEGWDNMGFPIAECRGGRQLRASRSRTGTGGLVTPRDRRRTDRLRSRRSRRLYLARRRSATGATCGSSRSATNRVRVSGAKGPRADRDLQGQRDLCRRLPRRRHRHDRRARGRGKGPGGRPRDPRPRAAPHPAAGFRRFHRDVGRGARRRNELWRAAAPRDAREVILKIGVAPRLRDALQIFAREIYPAAHSDGAGADRLSGGRPEPQPVIRLFSFLVDKAAVPVSVSFGGPIASPRPPMRPTADERAAARRHGRPRHGLAQRARRARAADRARPWPQRRQGRHRQYRRARAAAGIHPGCARGG